MGGGWGLRGFWREALGAERWPGREEEVEGEGEEVERGWVD